MRFNNVQGEELLTSLGSKSSNAIVLLPPPLTTATRRDDARYFRILNYIHMPIILEGRKRKINAKRFPTKFLSQSFAVSPVNRSVCSLSDMNNMTNVNFSTRKLRKPLMERKRRARINKSLDELYELLTESDFATKGSKLEKADILELTVQYLKQLKHRDYSQESKENLENVLLERYLSGFEKCAEEIETLIEPQTREKVGWHLKNCLERVKTQQKNIILGGRDAEGVENTRKQCSVLIQEPKDLKILPSKLPNGDVLLLLSSSAVNCEDRLVKTDVWRPWW